MLSFKGGSYKLQYKLLEKPFIYGDAALLGVTRELFSEELLV